MASNQCNYNMNTSCLPQLYPSEIIQDNPIAVELDEQSCLTDKQTRDGEGISQKVIPKRKKRNGCSSDSSKSKNFRCVKGENLKKLNGGNLKNEMEKNLPEKYPTGFIHVRARRGQATDSHSLAERARREKISVRLKILQHLVPGCDKINGKVVMLDEIITYIQALQNQVEFLSLRLASLYPMLHEIGSDMSFTSMAPTPLLSMLECTSTQTTTTTTTTTPTMPTVARFNSLNYTEAENMESQKHVFNQ